MSFIDHIAAEVNHHNRYGSRRQIENRSLVHVLGRAWSTGPRLALRPHYGGEWIGKQFKIDPTAPLRLYVYSTPTLDVDLTTREFTILDLCSRYQINALYAARLLYPRYYYATKHDVGGVALNCDNGAYFTRTGARFYETKEGRLRCLTPEARVTHTIISPESTAYVRFVRKAFRDTFINFARLLAGSDIDTGPYCTASMEEVFNLPIHARVQRCSQWFQSGNYTFDDQVFRAFMSLSVHWHGLWRYMVVGNQGVTTFNRSLRIVGTSLRLIKYHTLV